MVIYCLSKLVLKYFSLILKQKFRFWLSFFCFFRIVWNWQLVKLTFKGQNVKFRKITDSPYIFKFSLIFIILEKHYLFITVWKYLFLYYLFKAFLNMKFFVIKFLLSKQKIFDYCLVLASYTQSYHNSQKWRQV